jgi:hypothetical protein
VLAKLTLNVNVFHTVGAETKPQRISLTWYIPVVPNCGRGTGVIPLLDGNCFSKEYSVPAAVGEMAVWPVAIRLEDAAEFRSMAGGRASGTKLLVPNGLS